MYFLVAFVVGSFVFGGPSLIAAFLLHRENIKTIELKILQEKNKLQNKEIS